MFTFIHISVFRAYVKKEPLLTNQKPASPPKHLVHVRVNVNMDLLDCLVTHELSVFSLPLQLVPFPANPVLQLQLYESSVFAQSALSSQSAVPASHSLTSAW